jgi:hypothetical protein
VRFVDDDEVEMADAEPAAFRAGVVDQAHHGRIGRNIDAAFLRPVFQKIDGRGAREVLLEGVRRLFHQSLAVGEEQHALDPIGAHQEISQRDDGPRLARAGRHDQQRFTLLVALERFSDAANGAVLIRPLDDGPVDIFRRERLAGAAALNHQR